MTDPNEYGRHAVTWRVQEPRAVFPTEPKVKASTLSAAGVAAFVTPSIVRAIDDLWFGGGPIDVPVEHIGLIGGVVTLAAGWLAGWLAPHVDRVQQRVEDARALR